MSISLNNVNSEVIRAHKRIDSIGSNLNLSPKLLWSGNSTTSVTISNDVGNYTLFLAGVSVDGVSDFVNPYTIVKGYKFNVCMIVGTGDNCIGSITVNQNSVVFNNARRMGILYLYGVC